MKRSLIIGLENFRIIFFIDLLEGEFSFENKMRIFCLNVLSFSIFDKLKSFVIMTETVQILVGDHMSVEATVRAPTVKSVPLRVAARVGSGGGGPGVVLFIFSGFIG